MIICHCHAKTDRDVRSAARSGARDAEGVALRCAAGNSCGGCRPAILEILRVEARSRKTGDGARKSS